MLWAWVVGGVIALSIVTLNLGASIAIARSTRLTGLQIAVRLAAIWLLPLAGSMIVLHRVQETEPEVVPRELVAASGIGWGLIAASGGKSRSRAHDRHGDSGESDDHDSDGDRGGWC